MKNVIIITGCIFSFFCRAIVCDVVSFFFKRKTYDMWATWEFPEIPLGFAERRVEFDGLAGHKPEGLRKRWVFALRSSVTEIVRLSESLFVSKTLRCPVEWMKRNSTRCMCFYYMNCFGFKISCRNFNEIVWQVPWMLKTNLMSFSKLMTFPTNSWGKKRIYCSMGNCGFTVFVKKKVPKGSEEWSIVETLFWSEPKDLWGGEDRLIDGWWLVVHSFWRWYIYIYIYQWVISPSW